jgi:hypothetical protein
MEVNGKHFSGKVLLSDDVFEDMPVSKQLSKCVQTDICLTDSILPLAVKKHKYSQTHPINISENVLHYNLEPVGGPKKGSAIKTEYYAEETSQEALQHEQSLKSKLCESLTCHQSPITERRQSKGSNLETLKQARNLLKQRLEMVYMAQCTSMIYGNVFSIDNTRARRRLYCGQQADAARSMYECNNENVPFTSKSDTRQKRGIPGAEPMPYYTSNKLSRPQCQTQNIETLEFTHYSQSNISRRQKGRLVSLDDTVKPTPEFRPFVRQTTV